MGLAWQQGPLALGSVGRFLVPGRLPVDGAEAAIRAASPGVRASRRRQPCDATEAQVVAVIAVASSPNEGSGEVLAGFEPRAPTGQARVRCSSSVGASAPAEASAASVVVSPC
jgi:hypothetical protein